ISKWSWPTRSITKNASRSKIGSVRSVDSAPPRHVSVGLGLASLGMLTLQVSVTRLFSLLVWYHFAFLAIALALLGFTAGGVFVQLRPTWFSRRESELCLWGAGSVTFALLL